MLSDVSSAGVEASEARIEEPTANPVGLWAMWAEARLLPEASGIRCRPTLASDGLVQIDRRDVVLPHDCDRSLVVRHHHSIRLGAAHHRCRDAEEHLGGWAQGAELSSNFVQVRRVLRDGAALAWQVSVTGVVQSEVKVQDVRPLWRAIWRGQKEVQAFPAIGSLLSTTVSTPWRVLDQSRIAHQGCDFRLVTDADGIAQDDNILLGGGERKGPSGLADLLASTRLARRGFAATRGDARAGCTPAGAAVIALAALGAACVLAAAHGFRVWAAAPLTVGRHPGLLAARGRGDWARGPIEHRCEAPTGGPACGGYSQSGGGEQQGCHHLDGRASAIYAPYLHHHGAVRVTAAARLRWRAARRRRRGARRRRRARARGGGGGAAGA
jgi:hypothetical protein